MTVNPELIAKVKSHIGESSEPVSVTVDALTSQRYARAIGDANPIYFDPDAARRRGYEDVVVPPNFLPSYLDWSDGGPEEDLRIDGTPSNDMTWIPLEGVRLMGGGEEMIFHNPVYVDSHVTMTSFLDDVSSRETKSGLMMVMKIRNSYTNSDGSALMTSVRTVLGR